ncbi:hypothetical protein [Terrabacter terrigena]|uniref:Uncharacterized protein n=1 Tax=Terrabacter terrigena TaxID=574718 RepID=A0ABW3N220_9MICO
MAEMTIDEYLAAQKAEWGTYVAAEPIDINGARAFNPGDAVPLSHVENGVVHPSSVTKAQVDPPARNASREQWAAYALTRDGVTEPDIADLSRDQLVETYAPKEG